METYVEIRVAHSTPDGRLAIPHSTTSCTGLTNPFSRWRGRKMGISEDDVPSESNDMIKRTAAGEAETMRSVEFMRRVLAAETYRDSWAVALRMGTFVLVPNVSALADFDGFICDYRMPKTRFSREDYAADVVVNNEAWWRGYVRAHAGTAELSAASAALARMQQMDYPTSGHSVSDANVRHLWERPGSDRLDVCATVAMEGFPGAMVFIQLNLLDAKYPVHLRSQFLEHVLADIGRDMYRYDYLEPRIVDVFETGHRR